MTVARVRMPSATEGLLIGSMQHSNGHEWAIIKEAEPVGLKSAKSELSPYRKKLDSLEARLVQSDGNDLRVVGWFYADPGMGDFPSQAEMVHVHKALAPDAVVLLLINFSTNQGGFWVERDGTFVPTGGFYELLPDKSAPPIIPWSGQAPLGHEWPAPAIETEAASVAEAAHVAPITQPIETVRASEPLMPEPVVQQASAPDRPEPQPVASLTPIEANEEPVLSKPYDRPSLTPPRRPINWVGLGALALAFVLLGLLAILALPKDHGSPQAVSGSASSTRVAQTLPLEGGAPQAVTGTVTSIAELPEPTETLPLLNVSPTPEPPATLPPSPTPAPLPTIVQGNNTITLQDSDFQGGYTPAGDRYYGRTAHWVYGQGTRYSTITAHFNYNTLSGGSGNLSIVGLDSEDSAKAPIQITLNSTVIYNGPDPLPDDALAGAGSQGNWGTYNWFIAPSAFKSGLNTLTITNLDRGDKLLPPFLILDYAAITLSKH